MHWSHNNWTATLLNVEVFIDFHISFILLISVICVSYYINTYNTIFTHPAPEDLYVTLDTDMVTCVND